MLGIPAREQLLSLFPAPVCIARCDPGDHLAELSEDEKALAQSMGQRRINGFSAGRVAARDALAQLGVHDFPVLIGEKRKPIWPRGVCGSISHCKDQCLVVVASADDATGIGVDVEQLKPLGEGVQKLIMTDRERTHIRALDASVEWACVLFSIKESLFKCLNPLTGIWIDFHQANLTLDPAEASCRIELDPAAHSGATRKGLLTARFLLTSSHVFSAVTVTQATCR